MYQLLQSNLSALTHTYTSAVTIIIYTYYNFTFTRSYRVTCTSSSGTVLQTNVSALTHTFTSADGVVADTEYTCTVALMPDGSTVSAEGQPVVIRTQASGRHHHYLPGFQCMLGMDIISHDLICMLICFAGDFHIKCKSNEVRNGYFGSPGLWEFQILVLF